MITCIFENKGKGALRHAVVDVLVLRDNDLLMVKRAKGLLEEGKWALVGGFVDRDETIIQAVEREVREETGWKVMNVSLLRIIDNPDRPHEDRQNISFVYVCGADEKVAEGDDESEAVEWFPLDALPDENTIAFDHLSSIEYYRKQRG